MLKIAVLFVIVISTGAVYSSEINRINRIQNFWKAGPNEVTAMGKSYMKTLLGAKFSKNKQYRTDIEINESIPKSFDARAHWPHCVSIPSIKNQGNCGSCWAIGAASAASDRLCIQTNGHVQLNISGENLLACCSDCPPPGKNGCEGGYIDKAWEYLKETGLVTGGDYESNEGCQPYEIAPVNNDKMYIPPCHKKCTNSQYPISFTADKHYGKTAYDIPEDVSKIQSEILKHGPVEAGFIVYSDFFHYTSGVYVRTSDVPEGGHAVKILGWGVEKGVDYWLVANSWGRNWGENGLFKIRRGTNECDFESNIVAGLMKI